MLSERAQILLKTLVERYIVEGEPVGSRSLSKYSGLDLSPATIRNVIADLEDMGLVASPHTSSGRVPTARGYRLFVDSLLVVKPLEERQVAELSEHLHPDNPQRLVNAASQLLSQLTHFAGVVMLPRPDVPAFRHIEFLKLSERRLLLIIVTPEGSVQNRVIVPERGYSATELAEASNYLNQHYAGLTFDEIRGRLKQELTDLRREMVELMTSAIEAGSEAVQDTRDAVVVSGEHNLLDIRDLSSDRSRLRQLFDLFERKTDLLRLLEASRRAQGVKIFIGEESGVMPLDECSVVTAPYEVDGRVVGTLGVVGPTRMAYDRVIPLVEITARLLSGALSQQ